MRFIGDDYTAGKYPSEPQLGSPLVVIPVSAIISRVPSFIVSDNSETGTKRRSWERRWLEERTAVAARGRPKKEKAASAASGGALSLWTRRGRELFPGGSGPCMESTTTYETTPASSSSPAKSNTKVSLSREAWNAELFPVCLAEFPMSSRESGATLARTLPVAGARRDEAGSGRERERSSLEAFEGKTGARGGMTNVAGAGRSSTPLRGSRPRACLLAIVAPAMFQGCFRVNVPVHLAGNQIQQCETARVASEYRSSVF